MDFKAMSAAMLGASNGSAKAPRRKKFKKKKQMMPASARAATEPGPIEPQNDEAAEVVQFAHEPICERITILREVCKDHKPKPDRARAIENLATDLCDVCAWYDAAWLVLRPWLSAGDAAKYEADFGVQEADAVREVRKQPSCKGSTYRYLCAKTEQEICAPLRVLSESSAALSQTHRASIKLRDALEDWASKCEQALAAFKVLAARWLRKTRALSCCCLSETIFFKLAEDATMLEPGYARARRAVLIVDENKKRDEAGRVESIFGEIEDEDVKPVHRSTLLITLLSPGLASLEQWAGSERSNKILAHGDGELRPLSILAKACAQHRARYVNELHSDSGVAQRRHSGLVESKDDASDGFLLKEATREILLYSRPLRVPLSTLVLLGHPTLLRHAFTSKAESAFLLLRAAAGTSQCWRRSFQLSQIVAQIAEAMGEDKETLEIMLQFGKAFDAVEDTNNYETENEFKSQASDSSSEQFSFEKRAELVLEVVRALVPDSIDRESITKDMKPDVQAAMSGSNTSKISAAVCALQKEAEILNTGNWIEQLTTMKSALCPVDVARMSRLLGRAAASEEQSCRTLAQLQQDIQQLVSELESNDIVMFHASLAERLDIGMTLVTEKLPAPVDAQTAGTALKPLLAEVLLKNTPAQASQLANSLGAMRSLVADFAPRDEIIDANSTWIIEQTAQLILLERWLTADVNLVRVFTKYPRQTLESLAVRMLPFANQLLAGKSGLWAPTLTEHVGIDILQFPDRLVGFDGNPIRHTDELGTALLEKTYPLSHEALLATTVTDSVSSRAVLLKAERLVRSWNCQTLLSDATTGLHKTIDHAIDAVREALHRAAEKWSERRERAKSYGVLANAGARAFAYADEQFRDEVVVLRVQRFFEMREEARVTDGDSCLESRTRLLQRVDNVIQEAKSNDETHETVTTLQQVAQAMSNEEISKLFKEAASIVEEKSDDAQRLLDGAAQWVSKNRVMRETIAAAADKLASSEGEETSRLLRTAAEFVESTKPSNTITLEEAAAKLAAAAADDCYDATLADLQAAAAALQPDETARLLNDAAAAVENSDEELLQKAVVLTSKSEALGSVIQLAAGSLSRGDKDATVHMLKDAAASVAAQAPTPSLENTVAMLEEDKGNPVGNRNQASPHYSARRAEKKLLPEVARLLSMLEEGSRDEEYQLLDRLRAARLAEETTSALTKLSTSASRTRCQLRVDALLQHARDVGLPQPTALQAAALGLRFGRSWSVLRRAVAGDVERATTMLVNGDIKDSRSAGNQIWRNSRASNAQRVASLLGENDLFGVWTRMADSFSIRSDDILDTEAMSIALEDTVNAIRLAAFDAESLFVSRAVARSSAARPSANTASSNAPQPWRPPGPPVNVIRDDKSFSAPTNTLALTTNAQRRQELAKSTMMENYVLCEYADHDGGGLALNAIELQDALSTTRPSAKRSYGGGGAFFEVLAAYLAASTLRRRKSCWDATEPRGGVDVEGLSKVVEEGGFMTAYASAARRAGFSQEVKSESSMTTTTTTTTTTTRTSSLALRDGYGITRALQQAEMEEDPQHGGGKTILLATFERVLATAAGGGLRASSSLKRLLVERFRSSKDGSGISYESWLEWLIPRGATLELHVVASTPTNGRVRRRLQFCIDAWSSVGELRARIFRRLFWESHRRGGGGGGVAHSAIARSRALFSAAALYPQSLAAEVETAAAQKAAAVAALGSSRSSNAQAAAAAAAAANAAAAAAVAAYHRIALIGDDMAATPLFAVFSYKETIRYEEEVFETRPPPPKKSPPPEQKKEVSRRRPPREAHSWTPREVAAYFHEVEIPAWICKAVVKRGYPGSFFVYGSTKRLFESLDELKELERERVLRLVRSLRTSVLDAAWENRNKKSPHRWPPSVVSAFLLRSELDAGDGALLETFYAAGLDGRDLFGEGERGVVHDDTLRQLGVEDSDLRRRIREAAIRYRLEDASPGAEKKKKERPVRRRRRRPSQNATEEVSPCRDDFLPSDLRRRCVDSKTPIPRGRKSESSPPLEIAGGLDLFSVDSIQVPALESLRRVQDDGALLICRGFLDTSWIRDFADDRGLSPRPPVMTAEEIFAAFTSQLETEAQEGPDDTIPLW